MSNETNRVYDVLVREQDGGLTKAGTAYPTPKGVGYRATLKKPLSEGTQILLLPSRIKPQAAQTETGDEA